MKKKLTRGDFLKRSALYTTGISSGVIITGMVKNNTVKASSASTSAHPYPYDSLDVEELRIKGHDAYWEGKGCSYGAFKAIISALSVKVGAPFTDFPSEVMTYGHGGTVGWGGTCGAINGACAAISLVSDKATADAIGSELVGWCTQAEIPTATSNTYAIDGTFTHNDYNMDLASNVSGSPLCHVSVTNWCVASGISVGDKQRKERCARLTGDIVAKAVELLNDNLAANFAAVYVPPESVATCLACHGSAGVNPTVSSKSECIQCHTDAHFQPGVGTPKKKHYSFEVSQNYPNPFNGETTINFSLPTEESVTIEVYNLSGRHFKTLISNRRYQSGSHSITWDGNDKSGGRAPAGMYFYRINAGNISKSLSMIKQ
ncbi:MAG: C-GCAxxG-C-C family protein [Bacteroidales bacterium]|nr:C-GCAxxG-C-C family protein [Bacteroidales bacterium]